MSVPKPDALQLQDRDISLLRGLFECRVMTIDHATTLYFEGRHEAAKKRLQRLKAAGLISERPRQTFEPSVLFLHRKGLTLLQDQGVLAQYPPFNLPALDRRARVSNLTIRHELEVMELKTAFHTAINAKPELTIEEFGTWPRLYEFKAHRPGCDGAEVTVKPDGFVRIQDEEGGETSEHAFFLELDRSTEVQDILVAKAVCYRDYYSRGGFAVRNGAARSDFKDFPFRVLMVFTAAERRNNTAERMLQNSPPILTMVWLSTLEEVLNDPFGPIWIRPVDYRDVTNGTRFSSERPHHSLVYRKQTARDTLVETQIRKLRLLED